MKSLSGSIQDKKLRIWGVPILAIITSVLFTKEPLGSLFFFMDMLSFILGIFFIWEVNRAIIIYVYRILPDRKDLIKRLRLQLIIGIPISLMLASALFMIHIYYFTGKAQGVNPWILLDECREILLPTFMTVLCLNAFYENFFLNQLWQQSIIEAEAYKKSSLEAKFQNLKDQINPHFLFNSFNTLATLIEEHPQRAVSFVEQLSEVYRYVLNSKNQEIVSLERELSFAKSYIFLLKMRFENHLDIQIDIPSNYYHNYYIPPLTLQMLIENAIKHNEIGSNQPLKITIIADDQHIIVKNNLQKRLNTRSTGVGLENIRQRYQFLSQRNVEILETSDAFTVKLPLLSTQLS